ISKVAAENNMAAVTKPGTSEVVIVKPVQTRPVTPVNPSNPAVTPSTQKVVTAAPITLPTAARTTSVYKPVPNPPVPSLAPTVKPVPGFTTAWVNTIGGVSNDVLVDNAVLKDGNVVTAGITFTDSTGSYSKNSSAIIASYNERNKQLWTKTISGNNTVAFQSVAVLNDGSIIAVGYSGASNLPGLTDADYPCKDTTEALAVKFDKSGDIIWTKLYGGSEGDMLYAVEATPDGGFVVGGKSESKDFDFKDLGTEKIKAFVFKCDSNGNVQWRQALSGDKHSAVKDIAVTPAGEVYADIECVTGTGEYAAIEGTKNAKRTTVICKLGTSGNILWTKALYDSGITNLHAIEVAKDGGCVVAGNYTASANGTSGTFKGLYNAGTPGTFDGIVVKLKPDGSMGWLLPLIGFESDYITGIAKVDGGFAVGGYTTSTNRDFSTNNKGDYDCFIYTLNEYGTKKSLYSLGGSGSDNARSLASDGNGTVYICGSTNSGDGYFAECANKGSESKAVGFVARFVISE
ncbi:MAG: SBBP repeat-containing protein, partial [Clostridia bacterium]|nr:SBBP repeat-containing protein [Clostridia bacterium]